jgi:hypothetical protein
MRSLSPRILGFVVVIGLLSLPTACSLFFQSGGDGDGNDNVSDPDLVLFTDPDSDFSTTVVHDVDTDTVQFSISGKSIIYQDGTEYQAGSWTAEGNFLSDGSFQIRFGTEGGERKAYFTETAPGTICNFTVTPDLFQVSPTTVFPPQE